MNKGDFPNNFSSLETKEQREYLNKLLLESDIDTVINTLILNDFNVLKNLELFDSIRKKLKINKKEFLSKVINLYIKNNKVDELNKYLELVDQKEIKKIVNYEIENNTEFSKLDSTKLLISNINIDNKVKEKNKVSIKKIVVEPKITKKKKKSKKVSIFFIIFILLLICMYIGVGYCYKKIKFYNEHIYPNIYLDNVLLSNKTNIEVEEFINNKDNALKENIVFKNQNDNYSYTYETLGYSSNKDELIKKIINDYKKLNGYQKLFKIFFDSKKEYSFKYILDENKYNDFLNELRSKVNVNKTNEYFSIKNGVINYKKGINGFVLDEENIKNDIEKSITSNHEVILNGKVDETNNILGLINKKVSTFTTEYNESQGRAKNIRNAVSKLNGKILYAGETFSFYKTVGPYNGSRGYIFYAKDVGSGVCQVSTTIYNNVLLLNLPIVHRENHGDMVHYIDYGLDATVFGSSVDMKFKNNSKYPIYIEATASGGKLTVSFWSNELIVSPGYSYKPRVEKIGALSFKTYLDTYYNGSFVSSKYLNSSYYMKGK